MMMNRKPHHVERWYDRHERHWVIELKDANDFTIGPALFSGTKAGALAYEGDLKAAVAAAEKGEAR